MCTSLLQILDGFDGKDDAAIEQVRAHYDPHFIVKRCIELLKDDEMAVDEGFLDPASCLAISMRTTPAVWALLIQEKAHVLIIRRIWRDFREESVSTLKRLIQLIRSVIIPAVCGCEIVIDESV